MELTRKLIHRNRNKNRVVSQVTLDDDVIVPDTKEDLEDVLSDCARVELTETRWVGGRLMVGGRLAFRILYHTQKNHMVDCVEGELPFEEWLHVNEASEKDEFSVSWEIEDMSVDMVHSRKLNIKALLTLTVMVWEETTEQIVTEAAAVSEAETMARPVELLEMAVQMRDIYRVKEEIELSGSKPNISEVLWYRLEPRGIECRPLDGRLSVHGEVELFCIYRAEEDHIPLQWIERSLPFSGSVELPECVDGMVPDIRIRPLSQDVEAREDLDGEPRLLGAEMVFELEVKLYREEHFSMLTDIYCPGAEVELEEGTVTVDRLLTRNASKYKLTDKISLGNGAKILQICHADGEVRLEQVEVVTDGLSVEGTLCADVLYVAVDDKAPVRCVRGMLPFQYVIEAKGLHPDMESIQYHIKPGLEQIGAMVLGGGELEIKGVITMDALVLVAEEWKSIENARIVPLDPQKKSQIPGIVGYVVQPGDTLWRIAKKFYASVEKLRKVNGLTGEELVPGQKLLVIKEAEERL